LIDDRHAIVSLAQHLIDLDNGSPQTTRRCLAGMISEQEARACQLRSCSDQERNAGSCCELHFRYVKEVLEVD
jgi:hypothetical protein